MHIAFTYLPTQAELVRALRRVQRRSRVLLYVAAGLCFGLAAAEFNAHVLVGGSIWLALGVFYSLLLLFAQRLAIRKQAARLCRPSTVTLSDESVVVEDDLSRVEYRWDVFVKMEETPGLFLLRQKGLFRVLPKRAFSPEQAAVFSAFLQSRTAA